MGDRLGKKVVDLRSLEVVGGWYGMISYMLHDVLIIVNTIMLETNHCSKRIQEESTVYGTGGKL